MASPLLIAQLSDAHVGTGSTFLEGRMDTHAALRRAVAHLAAMQPSPDVVLFTGDLTEHGRLTEYMAVANALKDLPMPVYVVPGNHDEPSVAHGALARHMPVDIDAPDGTWCYHERCAQLHLIGLDTVVPRQSHGALGSAQLQWLERRLSRCRGEPVLLFMHHPPLPSGIEAMDACSLLVGADALAELIRRHGAVQGLLCGHLHRPVQMQFAGVPLHVAPSVAHQIALDLSPKAPLRARLEPPQISLHRWTSTHGLCTHASYVGDFGPEMPL